MADKAMMCFDDHLAGMTFGGPSRAADPRSEREHTAGELMRSLALQIEENLQNACADGRIGSGLLDRVPGGRSHEKRQPRKFRCLSPGPSKASHSESMNVLPSSGSPQGKLQPMEGPFASRRPVSQGCLSRSWASRSTVPKPSNYILA